MALVTNTQRFFLSLQSFVNGQNYIPQEEARPVPGQYYIMEWSIFMGRDMLILSTNGESSSSNSILEINGREIIH